MTHEQQNAPARIKIFVSTHKEAEFPQGVCFYPVQVGAANASPRFENTLHDDEGENISALNPMYNELTTQYWAWKNSKADYYGFCHYRRYFDFSSTRHEQNDYGEIIDGYIDKRTIAEYGLDDESVRAAVEGWDVITSPANDVRAMGGFQDIRDHWEADSHLHLADLRHMYDILCTMHPDYRIDANQFLHGHQAAFCNMFIMRAPIFNEYNEWLFPMLKAFADTTDFSRADTQTLRTVGHLSERLLNIFLMHHQRTETPWHIKQLQCVHFEHPEPYHELAPLNRDPHTTVPVVFAADEGYVPMLTTAMYSMLHNADSNRFYDIIVLEQDITDASKQQMQNFITNQFQYASLRFYNVGRAIEGFRLTTNNAYISAETYYRFIIQDVLPYYAKIIYLDSDLVVTGDIAQLYDTNIQDKAIGAVPDIDFLGNLNMKDGKRAQYAQNTLGMNDGYHYFQAGVLVMNLDQLRTIHSTPEWLTIAANPKFIYNDQDVLNKECEGDVAYLDYSWNVMHDNAGRVQGVFAYAPDSVYKAYLRSRENPKIIHFAGFEKPWKNPWCDFASAFWYYAQRTPFMVQLAALRAGVKRPKPLVHHERAIAEDSPLRKYVDIVAPSGSKQRELLKIAARRVRGRK